MVKKDIHPRPAGFPADYQNNVARRHPETVLQLLRLPQVKARVGLCRSSIYARIADGTFPPAVSLGARAVAWDSRAVDAWIAERIAQGPKA